MGDLYFNQPRMSKNVRRILIALVAVFFVHLLLKAFAGIDLTSVFGFVPREFFGEYHLWQIFTYSFFHGSVAHLFFNGLVLFTIGTELEFRWGANRFLSYFIFCCTGGALLESLLWASALLLSPESADRVGSTVIIGASGGLYGLLAAFGMLYAESRVHVFMVFPLKAKYFVMILMGIEIASVLSSSNDGVAHLAHLGGLGTGYLFLKIRGPNLDGRGGMGGFGKSRPMGRDEVRRRLNLIVNKDAESKNTKYPPTWN
jgi:membrane associated rhomboid family serine protease